MTESILEIQFLNFTGGVNFTVGDTKGFLIYQLLVLNLVMRFWNQSKWFTDFLPKTFEGAAYQRKFEGALTPENLDANNSCS